MYIQLNSTKCTIHNQLSSVVDGCCVVLCATTILSGMTSMDIVYGQHAGSLSTSEDSHS